jgi:hypothetical protein
MNKFKLKSEKKKEQKNNCISVKSDLERSRLKIIETENSFEIKKI